MNITLNNSTYSWNGVYELSIMVDTDRDGIANSYDGDDDNDAVSDILDICPLQPGNSTVDRQGCPDSDGDGRSNLGDVFPMTRGSGLDQDGDNYGDNASGTRPDGIVRTPMDILAKTATFGCPDNDGDGWADSQDVRQ